MLDPVFIIITEMDMGRFMRITVYMSATFATIVLYEKCARSYLTTPFLSKIFSFIWNEVFFGICYFLQVLNHSRRVVRMRRPMV